LWFSSIRLQFCNIDKSQSERWNLETHGINASDPRAAKYPYGYACELDAIPTPIRRKYLSTEIETLLPTGSLDELRRIEETERATAIACAEAAWKVYQEVLRGE
jgi:hypothetical protein